MELRDEIVINAPKNVVYDALNDEEILCECIPGCEELVRLSPTELEAKVLLKVGPVKARFGGTVTLDPTGAPDAFNIVGEGKGGAAGFAKGGAVVTLSPSEAGGTLLSYDVEAKVGGKLAQLGSRLIDGFAKKMADQFFSNFVNEIEGPGEDDAGGDGEDGKKKTGWLGRVTGRG